MGDSSSESDGEEISGIEQPSLLQQIKTILDEYRNDVQIIKELVQNADDAEATKMGILYEGHTNLEETAGLKYGKFFKTPALVFYNDAKFTDSDWKGIKAIYSSVKKNNPLKIGRFGLGFKSVFHMTDNPCIISGEFALFIDPLDSQPGKECTTMKISKWRNQKYQGYFNILNEMFGFSEETLKAGEYQGTIFFFPLRQEASNLADDIYREKDVIALFKAFISESTRSLLFLNTLCSVKMYVNLPNEIYVSPPKRRKVNEKENNAKEMPTDIEKMNFGKHKTFYSVEIDSKDNDLIQKRTDCLNQLKKNGLKVPDASMTWSYDLIVMTQLQKESNQLEKTRARWLVVSFLKGGVVTERTKELMKDDDLKYLHLVGLAAPIHMNTDYKNDDGHIFCYQPLPHDISSITKLPVHVNAFFALSQNRRQVRWPDENYDSKAQGDKKIEWNLKLATEMFPPAYYELINELVEVSKQGGNTEPLVQAVYNSYPNLEHVQSQWKEMAEKYVISSKDQTFLYTRAGGGKWIRVRDAVFADFKRYPDTTRCEKTIVDLLLTDDVHFVTTPEHVMKSLKSKFSQLKFVTPEYLRSHLKQSNSYINLTLDEKQDILHFIMLDLQNYSLGDLKLLPLADDSWESFSTSRFIFFEDPNIIDLFPGKESDFVSAKVRPEVKELLYRLMLDKKITCAQRLTEKAAYNMLKYVTKNKTKIEELLPCKSKWLPWVRSVWELLKKRFSSKLHMFSDLPLFPVHIDYEFEENKRMCLFPLKSNILFMPSFRQFEKREDLFRCMSYLGITLIDNIPQWLDCNPFRVYLQEDNNKGISFLFSSIDDQHIENFNKNSSMKDSAMLLKFLSERIHTDLISSVSVFKRLKLFLGFTKQDEWQVVSLKDCNKLYVGGMIPVRFPERLIKINTETEALFAKRLKIEIVTETDVILEMLSHIKTYQDEEKQILMKWIMRQQTIFSEERIQIKMRDIKFLKASDGKLYKPSTLFDPTDQILIDLFKDQSVFPILEYGKDFQYITNLKNLGLKSRDQVTRQDLEKNCTLIHERFLKEKSFNEKQCRALLVVMNEKSNLLDTDNIYNRYCILVEKSSNDNYPVCIPKKIVKPSTLCAPADIKSIEHIHLVGSTMYTLDCKPFQALSLKFGWQKQPSVSKVVEHLYNIICNFNLDYKSDCLYMITKIYRWLAEQEQSDIIKDMLEKQFASNKRYIWFGKGFTDPSHIYIEDMETDINLEPLLYKLPSEVFSLQDFFVRIGCHKRLDFDLYIDALYRIKEESEDLSISLAHQLKLRKLAVAILNKIQEDFMDEFVESKRNLYFPVKCEHKLLMKPTKQCTFCDAQWLEDVEMGDDEDIFYVHPDVSSLTAELLGVPSLRQQMLSNAEAFEDWGQEEPLTRRLRNLLDDGYEEGSIVKELFQNADDAGASELCILLDERENNDYKSQLISDGMSECQGPAIWVFNDALFSDDDFKNITKLSGGTKGHDSTKIGKFGLGFCSVYNLTDVPSFVSRDSVVIFDPHTSYLGKALSGKSPGLKINFKILKNLNIMKKMKNQFKPFENVFGCKLTNDVAPRIEGTLFRLPLRNKGSNISDAVYTPSKVKKMFNNIMSVAANMLLFSQNVRYIKLFHLSKSERNPLESKMLYHSCKDSKLISNINLMRSFLQEASIRKQDKQLLENPISSVQKVMIKVATYAIFDLNGGLSLKTDVTQEKSTWLVSWATGTDEKMIRQSYEDKGAINLGAVAVPVTWNDQQGQKTVIDKCGFNDLTSSFYDTGHLFFFLPLPIEHRFPFHINGQFAVSACRQQLHLSAEDDTSQRKREWNEFIFKDPVTCALLKLLETMNSLSDQKQYKFFDLWPRREQDTILQYLQKSFYRQVTVPKLHNVFEKNGHWFDVSRSFFLDTQFRKSEIRDLAFEVLSSLQLFVVDIPDDIYNSLIEADKKLILERTVTEETFFLEYFFQNLRNFEQNDKMDKILHYAVMNADKYLSIENWLKTNDCIPSSPHGTLKRPCHLINPESALAKLFNQSDERFPSRSFSTKKVLGPLEDLGLLSNFLSDDLVCDRAQSIQNLNKSCIHCAFERSDYFLTYICKNYPKHSKVFVKMRDISFFPVKCKPDDWSFRWFSEDEELNEQKYGKREKCDKHSSINKKEFAIFTNAPNMFYSECKDIVGCVASVFEESVNRVSDTVVLKEFLSEIGMKGLPIEKVELNIVLSQLQTIATEDINKPMSASDEEVIRRIYRHLENSCKSNNFIQIEQQLKDTKTVYVSKSFVLPNHVAVTLNRDCQPYLFKLGHSPLKVCPQLCKVLGIKDRFKPLDLARFVKDVKSNKQNSPLNSFETNAIINILKCLIDEIGWKMDKLVGEEVEAIFAPDENCILQDCRDMCFNDFKDIEKSETMIYAHNEITFDLARHLGIKPKAVQNLENHSEDITDFYQDEPLVTRLQRLVEGYPLDIGIFKELLQNADDAKATEVVFLKDYDWHPKSNLPDEKFIPLQGPALCVFNNSAFSNADLTGIQKLGRGSKADDPSQTGRYGVGFNAVYNLTDAPSFYTKGGDVENGETLCFFDPLAKYIPCVTRQKPGKRYKNVQSIRCHHNDMMNGYHEVFFPGDKITVFRFPLRTVESEIKDDTITIEKVSDLLESFCDELGDIVLFLKNIKTVRVISHKLGKYEEDFSFTLQFDNNCELRKSEFVHNYTKLCEALMSEKEKVLCSKQHVYVYQLTALQNKGENTVEKKYTVVQSLGFKDVELLPNFLRQSFLAGKIALIPYGGVALYTGDNGAMWDFDSEKSCKAFCFLPLPIETNLPVHVQGYFCLDHESRRTLWKSDSDMTGNCHRTLWNKALIESVIAPAYVELLENIKGRMFYGITGKSQSFSTVEFYIRKYLLLFPCNAKNDYWELLLHSVYKELVLNYAPFLPSLTTTSCGYSKNVMKETVLSWSPFRGVNHKFPSYAMPELLRNEEDNALSDFNNILRRIGMKVVFVTNTMQNAMRSSGIMIENVNPDSLIDFLCSFNEQSPDKCKIEIGKDVKKSVLDSVRDTATILTFCLKSKEYVLRMLTNIPLMITHDNIVRVLSDNERFYFVNESSGRFNNLFPTRSNTFLSGPIADLLYCTYESKLRDVCSLQQFGLQEFAIFAQETRIISTSRQYVEWNNERPSDGWIKLFWDFFKHIFLRFRSVDKLECFQSQMQIVKFLPLIPSFDNHQTFLVPYSDSKRLINGTSFEINPQLKEIFLNLGFQQIDENFFTRSSEIFSLLMSSIPNQKNPNHVLECLLINIDKLTGPYMDTVQANQILKYFDYSCRSISDISNLKYLPLYETYFGDLVSLSGFRIKIILDKEIPNVGLQKISAKAKDLALLKNTENSKLFEILQIKESSWVNLYEEYIIRHQDCLEWEEFYKHVEFLSAKIVVDPSRYKTMISLLKEAKFVETTERKRVHVSKLFDPSKQVFKLMCEKCELVPGRFAANKNVMKLFELIGLQTSMTLPLFIRFAKQIQESENLNSTMTVNKSKELMKNLWRMKRSFFYENDFKEFATIRFITPFVVKKEISDIHEQFNSSKLICFDGAILDEFQNISWTVLNILPTEADAATKKITEEFTEKLHICKRPSPEKLVQHCINIGRSLSDKRDIFSKLDISTTMLVMESIYQLLQEYMTSCDLTTELVKSTENAPIIYSHEYSCVHLARSIVNICRDGDVIPPYLNRCPNEFAKYHNLFAFLGAHKELDACVFSRVLKDIASECCTANTLLPKDLSDCQKAMGAFFKYLIQQNEDLQFKDNVLFLLSNEMTLDPSNMMVLANNKHYEKKLSNIDSKHIKLLFPIEKLPGNMKVEDCVDSLKKIPQKQRPHLLTDLMKERVSLDSIVNKDMEVASELEHFIHSPHFIKGFIRLSRHVIRMNNMAWNNDEEAQIVSKVRKIDFRHTSGIKTNLYLVCINNDGEKGDEMMIANTENTKFVHVEKCKNGNVCVYFDLSDQNWSQSVTRELTLHLNSLVNRCFRDESMMVLMDMIGLKSAPESIENFLSKEKIDEYNLTTEIKEPLTYPIPGTFVPEYLHDFLDNDYGVIQDYEYKFIAFELEDPSLTDDQENGETEREIDSTYIFVHINKKLENQDSSCPLLQEYEINDGTEIPRIVKAYQLFKFVRNRAAKISDVMIYTGNENLNLQQNDLSLKDARKEVRKILREAWTKIDTERRRIIKRLLLRWHPDKNHGKESVCTKVFQYIQQCLSRLEKGQELIDDDIEDNDHSGSSNFSGQWNSWSNRYWSRYQRRWKKKRYERPFNNFDDFTFSWGTEAEKPQHWYSEARRWMKQAESDLMNAELTFQHSTYQSFNWICYKAHQAAEKSLKAAWYAKDANKIWRIKYSHNLTSLASELDPSISEMARRLSSRAGDHTKMRYPDMCSGQEIPAEAYTRETAEDVVKIAQEILKAVKEKHIEYP